MNAQIDRIERYIEDVLVKRSKVEYYHGVRSQVACLDTPLLGSQYKLRNTTQPNFETPSFFSCELLSCVDSDMY